LQDETHHNQIIHVNHAQDAEFLVAQSNLQNCLVRGILAIASAKTGERSPKAVRCPQIFTAKALLSARP